MHTHFCVNVCYTKLETLLGFLYSMEELDHCMEAAHLVVNAVQSRLDDIDDNHKKSIRSSIALMLYLMEKLDSVQSSHYTAEQIEQTRVGMKKKALETISKLLKNWMQYGRMGTSFGCLFSPDVEIKVCNVL